MRQLSRVALAVLLCIQSAKAILPVEKCGTITDSVSKKMDSIRNKVVLITEHLNNSQTIVKWRALDAEVASTVLEGDNLDEDTSESQSQDRRIRSADDTSSTPSLPQLLVLGDISFECSRTQTILGEGETIYDAIIGELTKVQFGFALFIREAENFFNGSELGKAILNGINGLAEVASGILDSIFGRKKRGATVDLVESIVYNLGEVTAHGVTTLVNGAQHWANGNDAAAATPSLFFKTMCELGKDKANLLLEDEELTEAWKERKIANDAAIESILNSLENDLPCGVEYCESLACLQSPRARLSALYPQLEQVIASLKGLQEQSQPYLDGLRKMEEEAQKDQRRKRDAFVSETLEEVLLDADSAASQLQVEALMLEIEVKKVEKAGQELEQGIGYVAAELSSENLHLRNDNSTNNGTKSDKSDDGQNTKSTSSRLSTMEIRRFAFMYVFYEFSALN